MKGERWRVALIWLLFVMALSGGIWLCWVAFSSAPVTTPKSETIQLTLAGHLLTLAGALGALILLVPVQAETAAQISQKVLRRTTAMDAAYCSSVLREHSRSLGHVALIDHNPRAGVKIEFDPAEATRYNERTVAERTNARLQDEFGGTRSMSKPR